MALKNTTLIAVAALSLGSVGQSVAQEAGLLLSNGNIMTLDANDSIVNSVLVRDGRIVAVGNDLQAPAGAQLIDLEGRTMIPGLMDSHLHFIRHGQRPGYEMREVETVRSIAEFQAALSAKAEEIPAGELITVVTGWGPIQLAENRLPTLAELDEALPDNPAYIHYRAYGPAITNTPGRAMFADGGMDVGGDGVFDEGEEAIDAYYFLRDRTTLEQKARNTKLLMAYVNSLGMTSVIDTAGANRRGAQILEPPLDYDAIRLVWKRAR